MKAGFFVPFFVAFVITATLRKRYYYTWKYKVKVILISTLSFSGIILWLAWNAYAYNDPLEFANSPYFSSAAQIRIPTGSSGTELIRDFLFLQPWNVTSLYSLTALLSFSVLCYWLPRYSDIFFIEFLAKMRKGKGDEICSFFWPSRQSLRC